MLPARKDIGEHLAFRQAAPAPARALDDERRLCRRRRQRLRHDPDIVDSGRKMRRSRRLQPLGLRQDAPAMAAGRDAARFHCPFPLRAPIARASNSSHRAHRPEPPKTLSCRCRCPCRSRQNGASCFSSTRYRRQPHRTCAMIVGLSTLRVIAILSRAVPSGTVGGRIARMSKPSARMRAAMRTARPLSPIITGRICDPLPSTRALQQLRVLAKVQSSSKSARRCGSSTSILSASRTAAAISGEGAVE